MALLLPEGPFHLWVWPWSTVSFVNVTVSNIVNSYIVLKIESSNKSKGSWFTCLTLCFITYFYVKPSRWSFVKTMPHNLISEFFGVANINTQTKHNKGRAPSTTTDGWSNNPKKSIKQCGRCSVMPQAKSHKLLLNLVFCFYY